jgi:hypothetical protein
VPPARSYRRAERLRPPALAPQLKGDPLGSARPREAVLRAPSFSLVLTMALSMLPGGPLLAQFCWDCYQPRTIHQLVDSFAPEPPDTGFIFRGNQFPSRVLLTYTGKKRPVSRMRSTFLHAYFDKVLRQPLAVHFDEELLFLEDSVEYWLPVQSQVVPYFARELTPGDRVWVYIIWPGGISSSKHPDWVFLVNEFREP